MKARQWGSMVVLGLGLTLAASMNVSAEGGKMEFNANYTMAETLKQAQTAKQSVKVHLKQGGVFEGAVGSVGNANVVITKLAGREFYDAVVALSEIAAVEAKVRN